MPCGLPRVTTNPLAIEDGLDGEISEDGEEDERDIGVVNRKIPLRRRYISPKARLSSTDREVIRLIGQYLTNIGLKTSAEVLMQEAGCRLDQPTAAIFRRHVMNGDWVMAVKSNVHQVFLIF